ncbi:lasso peptide biosynthesis B2 protein [Lysinibacillus sp. FSL W8-0992]|uniref:lasso peptide biosynthesis B2 protein n=1 Tax=Lysinibacillus sp. FSL W8-0992 TaxID=2954643 RepID=UPI0030F4CC3F
MNECYFTTIHGFVRFILLEYDFEEAYEKIAVHMYPLYASATDRKVNEIDIDELYRLGQLLYRLDEDDHLVTSCVSIAVTIQAILFSGGYESDLLIGVKKIDQKLFSHAWVQLKNGKKIDPNNKIEDLKVLQIYDMSKFTERWVLSSL